MPISGSHAVEPIRHARSWRVGSRELELGSRSILVGVLNVTPDSFFDGGRYLSSNAAISRGEELIKEGADIVEVGGESTRPGSDGVSANEQKRRILPVITALAAQGALVAVDTRNSDVAAAALEAGASIVNDVSGLADVGIAEVAARRRAALVIMHAKGSPREMQVDPRYDDALHEVGVFLADRVREAESAGVPADSIAIDVGIGFGKRLQHNLALLKGLRAICELGRPVMLGVSRKSFLAGLGAGEEPRDRLAGSLAVSVFAYIQGVRIFRTHDVLETKRALQAVAALSAECDG